MAEKRKQPARAGREPANKKRASEAATPQSQSKKKAATPKAPTPRIPTPPPPEPVEPPLPSKINEGEPLPIRRARQPANLADNEYQSIAESAVILLSLERSKKKWLSDGILVRFYTKPKKTKREQIEKMNPPKESMVKVGLCDVTVGPHLFDAMLYTVKDPTVPQPVQYAPPQPPPQPRMVHYAPGNNFQQHQPYQSNQQRRPPYTPAPPGRAQGYQGNYSPAPRGPLQQGHATPGQRPQSQSQPGQPAKPSPDPVIQMLATRAAADPELKALMRVVASSQASQEQLRAFQAHIDELNAIIKAREQQQQQQEKRLQSSAATPTQQPHTAQQPAQQPVQQAAQPSAQQPATPASQSKPNTPANATPVKAEAAAQPSPAQGSEPNPPVTVEIPSKVQSTQPPPGSQPSGPAKSQSDGQPPSINQPQTPTPAQGNQPSSASQHSGSAAKQEPQANGPVSSQSTPLQPAASTPAPSSSAAITPTPITAPQQKQSPAIRPTPPTNNVQPSTHRPGPSFTPYQQPVYGSQPPLQSRPPQHNPPAPYPRPPVPTTLTPTRPPFKAVVFEFTSPLTPYGSSTSGHAGSGDRYLFPEYSILEYIPSENTILASFLIIRKVDANTPFPIETVSDTAPSRGKGKGTAKSKKGDKKGKSEKGKDGQETPAPGQAETSASTDVVPKVEASDKSDKPASAQPGTPGTPSEPPAQEANLKEYWQPVTFRIHASDTRVLEPLTRVVKPADEVRKYMNEVMDRAERAPDGFLALRLPTEDAREAFEAESTPASTTNANVARNRSARGSTAKVEVESEVENNPLEIEEEEEDLLDFYGAPLGLPPLRA